MGFYYYVLDTQSQLAPSTSVRADANVLLSQAKLETEKEMVAKDIDQLGAKGAYQEFKKRQKENNQSAQHEYAHVFGQVLYTQVGIPGVAICDSDFAFGCYHSFFGLALMEHGLDIIYDLEAACIEAYGERGLGCQHGIGHGVLAEVGYENLDQALEVCGRLKWKGPIGGCTSGVFMEYNFATMNGGQIRAVADGDVYQPCLAVADRFKPACYFELPQWWIALTVTQQPDTLEVSEPQYAVVANHCAGVGDASLRIDCYRGLGNNIAGHEQPTIGEIKERCALAPSAEGNTNCLQGAAWLLSYEPAYVDTWQELCSDEVGEAYTICMGGRSVI